MGAAAKANPRHVVTARNLTGKGTSAQATERNMQHEKNTPTRFRRERKNNHTHNFARGAEWRFESPRGGAAMSKKFNRCTIQIRKLPLEVFRLPRDGRKWKQLARSRYGLLLEISTFANGDGSFLSPDAKINFSPSSTKLLVHRSEDTLYRLADDLRELGLLSWHRNNHYGRRFYEIHLSGKQVRYSPENTSDIRGENTSDIRNNTSAQRGVITPPSSRGYPSLVPLPSGGSPGSPPLVFESVGHTHLGCTNTDSKTACDQHSQEKLTPTPPTPPPIDIFWDAYPTSKNWPSIPLAVHRAWAQIDGDNHLDEIIKGLERWKKSGRWQTERFVKDPKNFLIEKCFLVKPPSAAKRTFDHRRLHRA
jgi:hypothetical protein